MISDATLVVGGSVQGRTDTGLITMKPILVLLATVGICVADTPFKFGPCKENFLSLDTGIDIRNKYWKGELFLNIHSMQHGKLHCVRSTRSVQVDSSQYNVFHEVVDFKDKSGKGQVEFTEMYQVTPDHYVFKYEYDKGKFAEVHFKWLKFIPGILDMHYACSNDKIFAENEKDFIFVQTHSPDPSPTVSFQIRNVLEENKFKPHHLRMVSNCNCFSDQPACADQELYEYLEYMLP